MSRPTRPPTTTTLGPYELVEMIGKGGMCSVFRAWDSVNSRTVAVKILNDTASKFGVLIRRFEQEFRSGRCLSHPNIVRVFDFVGTHSPPYLVMELVDGPSLGQVVARKGPMPETEAIRVIVEVCRGLHHAHDQGVIHRDVKPDNVLLLDDGGVKVVDFGLSKELFGESNLTRPGRMLGTPGYMAPEQFRRANDADVRSDVYGVGATLYRLVTGQMPFAGETARETILNKMNGRLRHPREFAPMLSQRAVRAMLRAMSHSRDDRQLDLVEFVQDLTATPLSDEDSHAEDSAPFARTIPVPATWSTPSPSADSAGDPQREKPTFVHEPDPSPRACANLPPTWVLAAGQGEAPQSRAAEAGFSLSWVVATIAVLVLTMLLSLAWMRD